MGRIKYINIPSEWFDEKKTEDYKEFARALNSTNKQIYFYINNKWVKISNSDGKTEGN